VSWFKVDDSLAFHAKTVAAGNAAMGLWLRAGAWCAQQLTDGRVPTHMVRALGGTSSAANALVDAGLWLRDDDGYRFHDWADYQPSAAEVHADRAAKHEKKVLAGRAGGLASGVARRKHQSSRSEANDEANGKQNEAPTRPDPTQPQVLPAEALSTSGGAALAPLGAAPTAAAVVAAYITAVTELGGTLDQRAKGRIAKDAQQLLTAGAPPEQLLTCARRLATNGYADLAAELRRHQAQQHPTNRPSATDQRVAQTLALAAQLRDQETA
jgi:hypothetical protein